MEQQSDFSCEALREIEIIKFFKSYFFPFRKNPPTAAQENILI